jgi:RNA recognition motif-containing protein
MSKNIYVGNLSFQTTEAEITELFEQSGEVASVHIITDRETGRSKGFGFVEMGGENADQAIARLNGTDLHGRAMTVNEARPREDRPSYGGNRNDGRGGSRRRY